MSHFLVYVVTPAGAPAEDRIEKALAPYSENLEVAPHPERCYCVGRVAVEQSEAAAALAHGNWADRRTTFKEKHGDGPTYPRGTPTDAEVEAYHAADAAHNDKWRAHIAPALAAEAAGLAAHPLRDAANAECVECKGTGFNESTRNPRGYWDWYSIGGRWGSLFKDAYDPEKDPRNQETCFLCGGTGKRDDALGSAARKADPEYTCNGCQGRGLKPKWPTQWVDVGGNELPASELLARVNAEPKKFVPFALVDLSGEWRQKGKMGWFACVSGERPRDEWAEEVRGALAACPSDARVTVVDCHV